ncbi:MAG: hypothetical protein WB791_00645 [Waddliaceae bacterium]
MNGVGPSGIPSHQVSDIRSNQVETPRSKDMTEISATGGQLSGPETIFKKLEQGVSEEQRGMVKFNVPTRHSFSSSTENSVNKLLMRSLVLDCFQRKPTGK